MKITKLQLRKIIREVIEEDTVELQRGREWDIGASKQSAGVLFYNRKEEEHGDYKKLALIKPGSGKIIWYDKKLPSFIKKHIEKNAKRLKDHLDIRYKG